MPADKMAIKSLLMLPESMIQYTRMFQHNTSIMNRANLHHTRAYPFMFLNKRTDCEHVLVDDYTKEVVYDPDEFTYQKNQDQTKDRDQSKINYIGPHSITLFEPASENNSFTKYLFSVLPKTKTVLEWTRRELERKQAHLYSVYDIIQQLEPFLIYDSDITYSQYNAIRYYIKQSVPRLKQVLAENTQKYKKYADQSYSTEMPEPLLIRLLLEKKDLLNQFMTVYRIPAQQNKKGKKSHEILQHVRLVDGGNVYAKLLATLMSVLVTPNAFVPLEDIPTAEHSQIADACENRILAKKYSSLFDLEKDNGTEAVFFDKELDDLRYDLLTRYAKEQTEMSEEKFVPYFAENLVQKHGIPRDNAETYALQIIEGKRRVKEGQYALLEITPKLRSEIDEGSLTSEEKKEIESEAEIRTQTDYYIRKKTEWIKDDSIDNVMFMDDKQLFCNWTDLKNKNMNKTKNKNKETNPQNENAEKRKVLQEAEQRRILKEFDRRYDKNREVFEKELGNDLLRSVIRLVGLQRIRHIQSHYANDLAYEMGKQRAMTVSENTEIVVSPYLELKRAIVDDADFVEKQKNIVRFVDQFCREPMLDLGEDIYWKYCKQSNTKLMPAYLYTLAHEFNAFGQHQYLAKMNQIIALQGFQDGNAIYDKHSNEFIRFIDGVAEEGYTEDGFRIITNAVMEDDVETKLLQRFKDGNATVKMNDANAFVFETKMHQELHQIFATFSRHFAKFDPDRINDIRRISFAICEKEIISESLYEKQVQKQVAKGKKPMSYENMRNQQMVLIVVSVTFTFMQTAIPSFNKSRTMPSCVFSLDGFPLTGEQDTQGVKYIACVLKKLATDNAPWNTVYKKKDSWFVERLTETLKIVAAWPNIEYMYEKKRDYLQNHPEESIPAEYRVEKWKHFLPPIVKTDANRHISPVSASFINEFWGMAQKGQMGQTAVVSTIRSKLANYGYCIIEYIQSVVKSKELLMKTMSNIPFMQNACCNDSAIHHPILYFANQEGGEVLANYIKISAKLSEEVYRIQLISHPRTLAYKMVHRHSPRLVADETHLIYSAIIHYCKLDRGEIPAEFHGFFSEVPVGYNATMSLASKIAFLQQQRTFTENDLVQLMTIVRRKNQQNPLLETSKSLNDLHFLRFQNVLAIEKTMLGIDPVLVDHLRKLISITTEMSPVDRESDSESEKEKNKDSEKEKEIGSLRDYLYDKNSKLFSQIVAFLYEYGNLKDKDMEEMATFLARMDIWRIDETANQPQPNDGKPSSLSNSSGRVLQFMKNMVFDLTHYLPGIVVHHMKSGETLNYYSTESDNKKPINRRIHSYWALSMADKMALQKIIDMHYKQLYSFTTEDNDMTDFFTNIREHLIHLNLFMEELPHTAPFDTELLYMLSTNMVYSAMVLYIENVNPIRKTSQKKEQESSVGYDEEFEFEEEVYYEPVDEDEIRAMNENLAKLLQVFLNIHRNNKKYLDYHYTSIVKQIVKDNESEKERVMGRLEHMEKQERRAENLAKKYKLGVWSVGQQKGIFVYDKATSDRERAENLQQGIHDLPYDELSAIPEEGVVEEMDVEQMREEQEAEWDREQEEEMNAFPTTEGYMDGAYYSEDEDNEF